MTTEQKTIEVSVERTIPAPLETVYDAWLDPKTPGTVWNAAEKFSLDAKVDGLFFWRVPGNSHYGRFTEMKRPSRMQYTWVSPSTSGLESMVTVTFKKKGNETVMTLVHTGLPDTNGGKGHEKGWNFFVGNFAEQF